MEPQFRIAVVEDDTASAYSLEHVFRLHGLEVAVAMDASAGLAAIRAHRPLIVFSDLNLPDMSGLELASTVRREFGQRPVLVAVSANGDAASISAAIKAGFNAHFTKPANPLALVALARSVLAELGAELDQASD